MIYNSSSPADTALLAQRIARFIEPGDTLLLKGDLGAGKSHFARCFIQALGTKQSHIPSPTFTLVQVYDDTRLPLIHADLYRLKDASELDDLDMHDHFAHGVCLIEWPERATSALPRTALTVHFKVSGESTREVELTGDTRWQRRLKVMLTPADTHRQKKDFAGFAAEHGFADAEIVQMTGDSSFRQYFRVKSGARTAVIMDVPTTIVDEDGDPVDQVSNHVRVAKWLASHGLRVGKIIAADAAQGLILQEDLGDKTLFDQYAGTVDGPWLQVGVEALVRMNSGKQLDGLKPFTLERFLRNVGLFADWYLPALRGHATSPDERARFLEAWAQVYDSFKHVAWGVQLRDYHSPNFMVLGQVPSLENLALIDYQDATHGPLAFDLASLLYDARVNVPACLRDDLLEYYIAKTGVEVKAFETSFYLISLMRNARILGIFTRLAQRDGKRQYLDKMPILLPYIQEALKHPAAASVRPWLQKVEVPQI